MNDARKDRLFELLSDEALGGDLSSEESMELNGLKKQFPEWEKDLSVELAAAAVNLSVLEPVETLPANLREKILTNADAYFNRAQDESNKVNSRNETHGETVEPTRRKIVQTEPAKPSFFGQWLGWAVAAAACAALVFNLWSTASRPQNDTAKKQDTVKTPETIRTPPVELSAAQQREQLIASATDVIRTDLKAADAKAQNQFSGDVVWSSAQQKGFARFRGMPANDAAKESYQLWIVDATQDAKTPVSGGVFDISGTGEIVVPINAQLEIKEPKAFAVSREKRGGVVVSSPQRAVAVGKI